MKISDIISMCVRNLTRRKFRTILTVVGVVIGTCSIVVMRSLGIGIAASQEAMMDGFGNLMMIDVWGGWSEDSRLDDEVLSQIKLMEGVDAVTPNVGIYNMDYTAELFAGKKQRYRYDYNLTGVYPESMEKMGYTLVDGTFFPETNDKRKIRVMMGEQAAYWFMDVKKAWPNNQISPWETDEEGNLPDPFFDIMTEREYVLRVKAPESTKKDMEYEVEVVGVVTGSDRSAQYTIFMDVADMNRIQDEYRKEYNIKVDKNSRNSYGYNSVQVKAINLDMVTEVSKAIEDDFNLGTWSPQDMLEDMQQQSQTIQMILAGLGIVSLFVAAISITNTMIMSVYERTREIGVMKVLGCLAGNIRTIFLMEAGLIGFIGGVIGVGVSYLISFIMNQFGASLGSSLGYVMVGEDTRFSIIPASLVVLGIGFATLIGLVSGFIPANRAVKISALEAIKTE